MCETFVVFNEAVFCLKAKKSLHTGVCTGCHILLVCPSVRLCVRQCVSFVVFTDNKSCTRPISTNPGSMEAGEYGLRRGTCFLACGPELDAITGLLWISWCVLGGADFSSVIFFFFQRTRPAASMRPPLASFTSLLVMRQGRGSEATEAVFCL